MDDKLEELHKELVTDYIPVIISMVVLAMLGVFGNALTAIFYGFKAKRSSTTIFITSISVLNIFASFSVSGTVADLLINVKYSNVKLCKGFAFIMQVLLISTGLVTWVVSIDRYLKICRPKGVQFSERSAVVCVFLLCLLSLLLGSKSFAIREIVSRRILFRNSTVTIKNCSHNERKDQQLLLRLLKLIDVLTIIVSFVTFVFTYGNIIRRLKHHSLVVNPKACKMVAHRSSGSRIVKFFKKVNTLNAINESVIAEEIVPNLSNSKNTERELNMFLSASSRRSSVREGHIAIMMFIGSLGLIVSSLPYIFVKVMLIADDDNKKMTPDPGIQLMLRSPFFGIVIFPILFGVPYSEFRSYVVSIFKR